MITKTTPEDILGIYTQIREEDATEVRSITGLSVIEALTIGLMHSKDCITGYDASSAMPVLVAGVVPAHPASSVWMLSTPHITRCKRRLLTEGRGWIEDMTTKYGQLANVVSAENTAHIRLIKHMGFEFEDPIDNYGVDEIRVIPFKRNSNV